MVIELFVGNTRFDDCIAELLVNLPDAGHAVHHHGYPAGIAGGFFTVTEIFPGADRPNRHIVFTSCEYDLLNLVTGRRVSHYARNLPVRYARARNRFNFIGLSDNVFGS